MRHPGQDSGISVGTHTHCIVNLLGCAKSAVRVVWIHYAFVAQSAWAETAYFTYLLSGYWQKRSASCPQLMGYVDHFKKLEATRISEQLTFRSIRHNPIDLFTVAVSHQDHHHPSSSAMNEASGDLS